MVASFIPGVTETRFSIAVRLASSLAPAAVWVCEHGPMKRSPASSSRAHELGVLGHEAVAGEHVAVAVLVADRDHLLDALDALLLGGPGVVGDGVDVARVHDAELGRERARKDDAVALREQHPDVGDPHLAEDVDGLLADGAPADDQDAHVVCRRRSGSTASPPDRGGARGAPWDCRRTRRRVVTSSRGHYLIRTGAKRQYRRVRQAIRNLPLPAATGRSRSSCHAITCTCEMRRPSLKMSARARVGRGPAERR